MTGAATGSAVLCTGRLYCDLIFTGLPRMPSMGTEVFASGLGLHAGGGAYITAAWLATQGRRTALASVIPAEPFATTVLAELDAAGLDLSLCRPSDPGEDPQITIAIAGQADRAFMTRRAGPAAPDLRPADLRRLGVAHLHVGELATLIDHPGLIDTARAAGATVSLDCSWDEAIGGDALAGLLSAIDVFLPNEAEARHLSELGLTEPFAPLTVVKQGSRGATAIPKVGERVSAPALPVHPIDTTGAGDAFNAGFLHAWLSGAEPVDCLRAGNALGARAVMARGGFRPEMRPEVRPESRPGARHGVTG